MPEGLPCDPGFIEKREAFRLGAVFRDDNGEDRILVPARVIASLLSVILALLVWAAAWRMFGAWPAVAVMAMFVTEPVLVAHGSLVTTDMAIAMTTFLAVMAIQASREWEAMAAGLGGRAGGRVDAGEQAFGIADDPAAGAAAPAGCRSVP